MDVFFTWIAPVAVLVVGGVALWFAQRSPTIRAHPVLNSLVLLVLLTFVNALASPGGDLVGVTVGGVLAVVLSVAFYVALRTRADGSQRFR